MALSFKEKRALQKTVGAKQADLNEGGLKFKEKREVQKALKSALEELTRETIDVEESETLKKLIAGDYCSLPPIRFLSMLEKAATELDGNIEPIKPPAILYISKSKESLDAITESAIMNIVEPNTDAQDMPGIPMGPGGGMGMAGFGSAIRYQCFEPGNPEGPKKILIDIDQTFTEPHMFRGIIQALEAAMAGDIATLKINTPGGRTDAAQAVYVALLETKAKTQAKIINAASSGSIVAMACDEILPTPFCTMMVHNASAGVDGKVGDMAAASSHYRDHFQAWFAQLYDGFLTGDEVTDVAKGQEFYLKEKDIKARLEGWVPIRARGNSDLTLGV